MTINWKERKKNVEAELWDERLQNKKKVKLNVSTAEPSEACTEKSLIAWTV